MRAGRTIADRYELIELIGEGGMGEVWRATDHELRRDVAIKRTSTGDTNQLRREARIGAGMQHPNIITVFDVIRDGDDHLLVMEYFPARSLADLLDSEGALPPRRVAAIGAQLATALTAMHAKGMVHRDLTPANVLIADNGTAKLADLGIATWRCVTLTGADQAAGTPGYIAAEVAEGHPATPASDMFSLGATLFAAAEGTPYQPPATPRRAARLAPVLTTLLDPNPARRPTAEQAQRMLREAAGSPRRALAARVGAAVAAVAVLGVALWQLRDGTPTGSPTPAPPQGTPAVLGDPYTADPCALIDTTALAKYGQVNLDTDYGSANQCDVQITLSQRDNDVAQVWLELAAPEPGAPPAPPATAPGSPAQLDIDRPPPLGNRCGRTIRLADRTRVLIAARHHDDGPADLCAMANAMTDAAVARLTGGEIPRRPRPFDAASVFRLNACTLLDTAGVTKILGPATEPPRVAFANWDCTWDTPGGQVLVRFDRMTRLLEAPDDGNPIILHSREAWVEPNGDGNPSCNIMIVYRSYPDPDSPDDRHFEHVRVVLRGEKPAAQLCPPATKLAETVAARLPR